MNTIRTLVVNIPPIAWKSLKESVYFHRRDSYLFLPKEIPLLLTGDRSEPFFILVPIKGLFEDKRHGHSTNLLTTNWFITESFLWSIDIKFWYVKEINNFTINKSKVGHCYIYCILLEMLFHLSKKVLKLTYTIWFETKV